MEGLRAVEVTRLVGLPAFNGSEIMLDRLRLFILAYFRLVVDEAHSGAMKYSEEGTLGE